MTHFADYFCFRYGLTVYASGCWFNRSKRLIREEDCVETYHNFPCTLFTFFSCNFRIHFVCTELHNNAVQSWESRAVAALRVNNSEASIITESMPISILLVISELHCPCLRWHAYKLYLSERCRAALLLLAFRVSKETQDRAKKIFRRSSQCEIWRR